MSRGALCAAAPSVILLRKTLPVFPVCARKFPAVAGVFAVIEGVCRERFDARVSGLQGRDARRKPGSSARVLGMPGEHRPALGEKQQVRGCLPCFAAHCLGFGEKLGLRKVGSLSFSQVNGVVCLATSPKQGSCARRFLPSRDVVPPRALFLSQRAAILPSKDDARRFTWHVHASVRVSPEPRRCAPLRVNGRSV